MLFTDRHGGVDFAKDPAVVKFGDTYFMYYTTSANEAERSGGANLMIGMAKSADMENWEIFGTLPLDQPCEKVGLAAPAAIVLDGLVHIFYQSHSLSATDAICHAVSADGMNFTKDPSNPVFRPTNDWCCGRAIDADICVFGDYLYMYFATRDHAFKIQKVGGARAKLGSGYGRGDWEQLTNQVILHPEMDWEMTCIEAPATIVEDGKIYMFYAGAFNCSPQQIGCAVSSDGVLFRRVSPRPLLGPGSEGAWNSCESGHPYVFRDDDGKIHLFYQGSPDMGKNWYLSRGEIKFENGMPRIIV